MTMQQRIEAALRALQPEHLQVLDESHMHSRGLETHFKAVLVASSSPASTASSAIRRSTPPWVS